MSLEKTVLGRTLKFKVFGEDAKKLCEIMGLEMSGDENDLNTKVWFYYKPVEGHAVVDVSIDI
jgi:hypothetical protein